VHGSMAETGRAWASRWTGEAGVDLIRKDERTGSLNRQTQSPQTPRTRDSHLRAAGQAPARLRSPLGWRVEGFAFMDHEGTEIPRLHPGAEERLLLLAEASGTLLGNPDLTVVLPTILDLSRRLIAAD